tara:strand:+ start:3738 stop:5228 length:1491 start_codon:yes stop_codon:yes gene_type:complete
MENINTLVVGGGFGGIAAALRCKAMGHNVTIIDKLSKLGGRAQVIERNGYKYDTGPTVITAPFLIEELFNLFNEKLSDHLEFKPLDPWYRFHFHDSTTFDYSSTVEETKKEISKFSPEDAKSYDNLLKESEKIFDIGFTKLSDQPFTSFWTMIKQIPYLLKLKSYESVSKMVSRHIKNKNIRSAFSIHPLLVGGNPYTTTSIYSLIHFLERKWGVFFCMGGTGKLVEELTNLMKRNDINIETNKNLKSVEHKDSVAYKAITECGKEYKFDNLIFNGDPPVFYKEILKPASRNFLNPIFPAKSLSYSMGLFVLFFGTKTRYEEIAHHTIWLTERFKDLLHDIFEKRIITEDFSLYLHRPTATDKSFAPDGHDSFYVLCPVPNLKNNIDWSIHGEKLKDQIIIELEKTIMPNLSNQIEDISYMTPKDFKNNYRSMYGAGFSIAPKFTQSAWFRYHNEDDNIPNIFFSAAGSHPGAGLPGVLSSAKVVENILKKRYGVK